MRTVCEELDSVFENEALYVSTYDEQAREITISYGLERGETIPEVVIPLGEGLTSYVIREKKPLHIRDLRAEVERGEVPSPRTVGQDILYSSWIGAPMVIGDRVLGVIAVMIDRPNAYTDEQAELLFTIADQVSLALENARLYAAVQQELRERQRVEEQLRRNAEDLADANEEIKQFAYIVSHDLRAPLVNLKGFTAELRMSIDALREATEAGLESLPEDQQQEARYALEEDIPEALGFIETAVSRMDGFINAVLKLSRLGRRQLRFESLEVGPIVEAVRESLAHQLDDASAELVVGTLPDVVADRTAMEQIFGNLITNAVIYLDPQRPGRIEVGGERRGDETLFWVRDNGRGIAEADAEKVFAPFRRAGKQDVPGEGMGLSYVHTIVRQHGGRIWFESEPDVGTTFYFTITDPLGEDDPHDG
jgi:signal transduction histidine kinase